MASNLNKAFMRAYAKDRSAANGEALTAPAPTPTVAPTPAAAAQPSMEPTVFAGRYAPPQAANIPTQGIRSQTAQSTVAQSTAPAPAPQPQVMRSPTVRPQAPQPTSAPHAAVTRPPVTGAAAMTGSPATHRIPAPGIQAASRTPQSTQSPLAAATAERSIHHPSTRIETVQASDSGDVSRVWQRIDAAHDSQASHPSSTQARPAVSVGATRSTAPQRMQAAAAAPVAPAVPASPMHTASPAQPAARQLPLVGDENLATQDIQPVETRRRTVADFLYSAGQYNPGRILASADQADSGAASVATAPIAPTLRTSGLMRAMEPASDTTMPYSAGFSGAGASSTVASNASTSAPAAMPTHPYETAADFEEPLPRRMGQIVRVDVPRGHSAATSMPATMPAGSMPTAMPAPQPPMQPAPSQQTPSQPASPASMSTSDGFVSSGAHALDAPVAKYVLEQRRMDRAHKLNEAEDKLRRNTHKIFNPVWEVDSLQWPAVVDKLMQQRAQSMAHVAEHMKSACQDGLSVLGVTSASQAEGRTTVACCLARLAAAHGLNVALVDIDLDHPTLCVQTNMEVEHDWRDCLSEDISLEEVAVHSIDDQLTVLPLKPRGGRPGLLASDSRIADILADLSDSFELVIVDCSKTSSSGNVITGLAHTKIFDAAIVVVDRRDGEADRVEDAVRMIQQTGIESIGIVDNFSM